MLDALNNAEADYLIVGAYAMAAHGCPRSTGDIDFWVRRDADNAKRVWTALANFGAPVSQITLSDLSTIGIVFQIGVAPQRIDVLTSISGVEFEDAWPDRLIAHLDGVRADVIGREYLIQNKLASARPKDLLDVDILRS